MHMFWKPIYNSKEQCAFIKSAKPQYGSITCASKISNRSIDFYFHINIPNKVFHYAYELEVILLFPEKNLIEKSSDKKFFFL